MLEIKKILQDFGLTEKEAQIYLVLLSQTLTASEIAQKTNVHRINVYDILERLQEKGLISYSIIRKRKVYETTDPKKLLEEINEKRDNIKKILPELIEKKRLLQEPQEVTVYKDYSGIKNIMDEHTHSKTPVYLFSSGWGLRTYFPDYYDIYNDRLIRNKVNIKILFSKKFKDQKLPKVYKVRYLPVEYSFPSSTTVYENKVLIVMWTDSPMAILIKGKEVAESYRHYFEMLWKNAEKPFKK